MRFKFTMLAAAALAMLGSTFAVHSADAQYYRPYQPYYYGHHHHHHNNGFVGLTLGGPTYPAYGYPYSYGCPYGYYGPGCYPPAYGAPYSGANFSLSVPIR